MEYTVSDWFGYERRDFRFTGRDALIVLPKGAPNGRWAVKTEYFGAFPNLELELLARGWCVAYLKNVNRWGTDADSDAKAAFVPFMAEQFGLEPRFACVGMSCGGLCSVNFAAKYPSLVSVLYLDAPVMNLLSCPMGFGEGDRMEGGWEEIRDAVGFSSLAELLTWRGHPMDRLEPLAEHRIPAALVYGEADKTVPYLENGAVLERFYRKRGLPLLVAGKPGCGHHPHGLENPKPLADFIEAWAE